MIRRIPWWAAAFLLALAARLAWRFGADEPLLYSHQYHYWEGALRIVEHPRPFWYLLYSDEWRQWPLGGPWTIAPLYYVFLAALLAISGSSLVFVQVVQSVLDALVAIAAVIPGRATTCRTPSRTSKHSSDGSPRVDGDFPDQMSIVI